MILYTVKNMIYLTSFWILTVSFNHNLLCFNMLRRSPDFLPYTVNFVCKEAADCRLSHRLVDPFDSALVSPALSHTPV